MNPETLEALKGSIRKWEDIAEGTGADNGWRNCPLCQLFYREDCLGCPVAAATAYRSDDSCERRACGCDETPYTKFCDHCSIDRRAVSASAKAIAEEEVQFLRSLLPKEEKAE